MGPERGDPHASATSTAIAYEPGGGTGSTASVEPAYRGVEELRAASTSSSRARRICAPLRRLVDSGSTDHVRHLQHSFFVVGNVEMSLQCAEKAYQEWLDATPLEQLRLKPTMRKDGTFNPRVEQRGISMMLAALPDQICKKVIASRRPAVTGMLFRLFTAYQPGGGSGRGIASILDRGQDDGRSCGSSSSDSVVEEMAFKSRRASGDLA